MAICSRVLWKRRITSHEKEDSTAVKAKVTKAKTRSWARIFASWNAAEIERRRARGPFSKVPSVAASRRASERLSGSIASAHRKLQKERSAASNAGVAMGEREPIAMRLA